MDDERLLIIQTNRLSAFDVVLHARARKGRSAHRLVEFLVPQTGAHHPEPSAESRPKAWYWYECSQVARRVRRATVRPLPIEALRGYLKRSGWKEYR